MLYNNILENVENLPLNMQIRLVATVKSRIIENKRELIKHSALVAKEDYQKGILKEESADELITRLSGISRLN
ncbi:MAG: hypothetical protein RO257_01485 [Candidatus Kapabacteria bacterium]|jgi:hypothetical protein|nr:hypothetical protein [Candidatus Kapabacteria bacterium]